MKHACIANSAQLVLWDQSQQTMSALVGCILAIIHPNQLESALQVKAGLTLPGSGEYPFMDHWKLPFDGVAIITNRQTPQHVDAQGWKTLYDLLITLEKYTNGDLELADISLRFRYKPGTVIAIHGAVLRHAAETWEGERVCLAHFTRATLCRYLDVPVPHWSTADSVLSYSV